MFKVDLARAYRQLPSDPWDWVLLGLQWNDKLYFDTAIPFGVRHGAMACQRTTQALCHIQTEDGNSDAEAYIDDMASVCMGDSVLANKQYTDFLNCIDELGLEVSLSKCASPSVFMTWIGVTYDSVRMIMFIEKSKIDETLTFCHEVLASEKISKTNLRSLLGKLNHASKLSPPARRFLNRLLFLLRQMKDKSVINLSAGAKLDIMWFTDLLEVYNCTAVIRSFSTPEVFVEVDACLVGGGGISIGLGYFFYAFPKGLLDKKLHISALESFNLLVSLRLLAQDLEGKTVQIFCDNSATVSALNSGKSRDKFMAYVLREVWFLCATLDIQLLVVHKAGKELVTADLLSRGFKTQNDWLTLCKFRGETNEKWLEVDSDCLSFPIDEEVDNLIIESLILSNHKVRFHISFDRGIYYPHYVNFCSY